MTSSPRDSAVSHIERQKGKMVMSCSAVRCTNRASKGSGISFYRFPADPECRAKWVVAVRREDWQSSKYTWICSAHFISEKSDDPYRPITCQAALSS